MKIVIISQVFWPDTASTAQHLIDFAECLVSAGHNVTVYASRYAYENTSVKYPKREIYNKISIKRLSNTRFGKGSVAGRLTDFITFNALLFSRLLFLKKSNLDLIIGMTSPPLVSYLGVLIAFIKKKKFVYWGMDLQPELAIASGLLNEKAISSKLLTYVGNMIIRRSDAIIALDKYMKSYFIRRGADENRVHVVPVWPVMNKFFDGSRLENPFRIANDFGSRIIVMYSGNHSYVHPLDTLLNAALLLRDEAEFLFVFIGDGVRKEEVSEFKEKYKLGNIVQLPYQPREQIHLSLGASDIQVVIMGNGQVGFTHPNKIYGAMFIGKPILYIGPPSSHVIDILSQLEGNIVAQHGNSYSVMKGLLEYKVLSQAEKDRAGVQNKVYALEHFHPDILKMKMVEIINSLA